MHETRVAIVSENVPTPKSAFSVAMRAAGLIFVSGQLGLDMDTGQPPANVGDEAELAIGYVRQVLAESGLGLKDVVKTTLYVTNFSDYATINKVYSRLFPQPFPARATVQVAGLLANARLEIEAVAVVQ